MLQLLGCEYQVFMMACTILNLPSSDPEDDVKEEDKEEVQCDWRVKIKGADKASRCLENSEMLPVL